MDGEIKKYLDFVETYKHNAPNVAEFGVWLRKNNPVKESDVTLTPSGLTVFHFSRSPYHLTIPSRTRAEFIPEHLRDTIHISEHNSLDEAKKHRLFYSYPELELVEEQNKPVAEVKQVSARDLGTRGPPGRPQTKLGKSTKRLGQGRYRAKSLRASGRKRKTRRIR